jgi:hypothetical protein
VNSTVLPYIADSYRGSAPFPTSVGVSPALIEKHFEQRFLQSLNFGLPPTLILFEVHGVPVSAFLPLIATLTN